MKDLKEMTTTELERHLVLTLNRAKDRSASPGSRAAAQAAYDAAKAETVARLDRGVGRPTRRRPVTSVEYDELFG